MEDLEQIVAQLASASTPLRIEAVEQLKLALERVDAHRIPENEVKDLIDAAHGMAKSHNTKVWTMEQQHILTTFSPD
jgi:hypothetical protein